ncbi:restriction endonuclease subunit S [Streptomyces sp. WL006]|uniref:restriction endonuclease subunit S n=1 Tax=Streptomyces sp. WL006 TaxID=3423915 RepID=UPI003F6A629D
METWPHVPFANLAAAGKNSFSLGPFGSKITTEDYTTDGVPFIRGINLNRGAFRDADFVFITEDAANEVKSSCVSSGDLIFTRKGTIGQVSMIPRSSAHPEYVISSSQMKAKLDESRSVPEFYYYWFRSPQGQRALLANASQVGVPSIANSLATLRGLKVPTPPRRDQAAIAEVLGSLDDKIMANERASATILSLARARSEAASATTPMQISEIADIFDGPHATPTKTTTGPWFLSISSLKQGILDLSESAHLAEEDFPRWTRRVQPSPGDVLFSYETRLGEAALMPPGVRASLGRRMALLRPKSTTIEGVLLLHAFLGAEFQSEIQRRTVHGATVDRIPLKEMGAWPIHLPVEGERLALSCALRALHADIEHRARENDTLTALRDTLLPHLVTGKIRVKDAERIVEDAA